MYIQGVPINMRISIFTRSIITCTISKVSVKTCNTENYLFWDLQSVGYPFFTFKIIGNLNEFARIPVFFKIKKLFKCSISPSIIKIQSIYLCNIYLVLLCGTICFFAKIFTFLVSLRFKLKFF